MLAPWEQLSTVRGTPGKGNSLNNGAEVETAWGTSRDLHAVHPASEGSRKTQKLGYKAQKFQLAPACATGSVCVFLYRSMWGGLCFCVERVSLWQGDSLGDSCQSGEKTFKVK